MWKESTSKEVELHDDDEKAVDAMLKFVYGLGYTIGSEEPFTTHAKVYAVAEKYGVGGLHECITDVFRDKINDWQYKDLRQKEGALWGSPVGLENRGWASTPARGNEDNDLFIEDDASEIHRVNAAETAEATKKALKENFYEAVKIVYTFTTEKDKLARPLLAGHCAQHAKAEEDKLAVRAMVRDFPELGLDLFDAAFSRAHNEIKLWMCNRCGKMQDPPFALNEWGCIVPAKCQGCKELVRNASGTECGSLRTFVERGF